MHPTGFLSTMANNLVAGSRIGIAANVTTFNRSPQTYPRKNCKARMVLGTIKAAMIRKKVKTVPKCTAKASPCNIKARSSNGTSASREKAPKARASAWRSAKNSSKPKAAKSAWKATWGVEACFGWRFWWGERKLENKACWGLCQLQVRGCMGCHERPSEIFLFSTWNRCFFRFASR
ncbi:MAG: hypothetical protein RLZZ519_2802 [Bacteroidota bacterium]